MYIKIAGPAVPHVFAESDYKRVQVLNRELSADTVFMGNTIIITAPSLNENINVSGISSVTSFIINNNPGNQYIHFELGKSDNEKRNVFYFVQIARSFARWRRLLMKKDVIVHFNFALEKKSILRDTPFVMVARLSGRRMIIHLHGGKFLVAEPPGWLRSIMSITLTGREPKIVLSGSEKELVQSRFGSKNVYVLPNSISLVESANFEHAYLHGKEKPLHLLFLGRIIENKGVQYIYEACKLLTKQGIDFKLYMAGKGPDEARWLNLFSSLLGEKFIFKGVVAGKEKIALIKECDVFLLPSILGEGLPIALLESMSFGLVPVTTNDGSMEHLVKNGITGLLVKKHSAEDIANAICELNSNQLLLQTLGKNSKKHITDNYNPDKYIDMLNNIYAEAGIKRQHAGTDKYIGENNG